MEFHPLAGIFPMMEEAGLAGLALDIKTHGLRESIELYEDQIIDGRNRYRACEIAGVDPHFMPLGAPNDAEALAYIVSKNLHRRHLTTAQRGDLVDKLLRATPEKSDRAIGKLARVDGKTVAGRRAKLEAGAEIPHLEARTGTDGKEQPATKAPATTDLSALVNQFAAVFAQPPVDAIIAPQAEEQVNASAPSEAVTESATAVKIKTRVVRVQVTDERSGKAHIVPFVVPVAPPWHEPQAEADPTPPARAPDPEADRRLNSQLAVAGMREHLARPRPAATPPDEPEPPHLSANDRLAAELASLPEPGPLRLPRRIVGFWFFASTDPQKLAQELFQRVPLAQFRETIDAMFELLPKA